MGSGLLQYGSREGHHFELGVWSLEFGAWSLALGVWRLEFGPNAHAHACANNTAQDYLLLSTGSLACPAISCCPTTLDQHQELGAHQDGLMKYQPCMVNKPYLLVHFQHD